jgi:hypothetical protein
MDRQVGRVDSVVRSDTGRNDPAAAGYSRMGRLRQYLLPFCLPITICGIMLMILPSRALRDAGHSPPWVKGAGMLTALVGSVITLSTKSRQADHDEGMGRSWRVGPPLGWRAGPLSPIMSPHRFRLRTLLIAVAVAALISYSIRIDGGGSLFFFPFYGALLSDMWRSPRPRPAN